MNIIIMCWRNNLKQRTHRQSCCCLLLQWDCVSSGTVRHFGHTKPMLCKLNWGDPKSAQHGKWDGSIRPPADSAWPRVALCWLVFQYCFLREEMMTSPPASTSTDLDLRQLPATRNGAPESDVLEASGKSSIDVITSHKQHFHFHSTLIRRSSSSSSSSSQLITHRPPPRFLASMPKSTTIV
jgi:hypothetical protein